MHGLETIKKLNDEAVFKKAREDAWENLPNSEKFKDASKQHKDNSEKIKIQHPEASKNELKRSAAYRLAAKRAKSKE